MKFQHLHSNSFFMQLNTALKDGQIICSPCGSFCVVYEMR